MTSTQKKALQRYVLLAQAQREVGRELNFADYQVPLPANVPALRDLVTKLDRERVEALSKVLRVYDDKPEQGTA